MMAQEVGQTAFSPQEKHLAHSPTVTAEVEIWWAGGYRSVVRCII